MNLMHPNVLSRTFPHCFDFVAAQGEVGLIHAVTYSMTARCPLGASVCYLLTNTLLKRPTLSSAFAPVFTIATLVARKPPSRPHCLVISSSAHVGKSLLRERKRRGNEELASYQAQ